MCVCACLHALVKPPHLSPLHASSHPWQLLKLKSTYIDGVVPFVHNGLLKPNWWVWPCGRAAHVSAFRISCCVAICTTHLAARCVPSPTPSPPPPHRLHMGTATGRLASSSPVSETPTLPPHHHTPHSTLHFCRGVCLASSNVSSHYVWLATLIQWYSHLEPKTTTDEQL